MSNAWVLGDGIGFDITIRCEQDLRQWLDRLDEAARERGTPMAAMLHPDTGTDHPPYLAIGLGAEHSVLAYSADNCDGGHVVSKGPWEGDDSQHIFGFGSATTVYLGWMLIPRQAAYTAAVEFLCTGQQPTGVQWSIG